MKETVHQHPDEQFEVYDDKGRKTGLRKRSEVHGNPALIHRVAHVLVFNSKGDLYLQKRAEHKDVQPGKWDTSVGGHLNPKESFLQAARREMQEELGLPAKLKLVHLYDYPWRTNFESEDVRTFAATWDEEIVPNPEEISEGRFWDITDLKKKIRSDEFTANLRKELELCQSWGALSRS
ncbi:MAG: NUDIX domain-containing protein [Planctomycetota bacterium]|nr:NUDIX domain-containing protein [Planctomycetota bacterium]